MHEYSIVSALLDRVEGEARARGASRVARIQVRIGALSGVEPELLRTAYEMARESTLCDGADLDIVPVEARWACTSCEAALPPGAVLMCPACGANVVLAGGDEIVLERIEMEVA